MAEEDYIQQQLDIIIQAVGARTAAKDLEEVGKSITSVGHKSQFLGKQLSNVSNKLANFSKGVIKDGLKVTVDYNKSMLSAAASVRHLGIGLTKLESIIQKTAKETYLTRKETASLFKTYSQSFTFSSLEGFNKIMVRIKRSVGSNSEAMQEHLSTMGSLSEKYSEFVRNIENMGKGDVESKLKRIGNLFKYGDMSLKEYTEASAVIIGGGGDQGDSKIRKRMQGNVETAQSFNRIMEKTQMIAGEQILPKLEGITKSMDNWMDSSEFVKNNMGKIALSLAAISVGVPMAQGALAFGMAAKASGAAAAAAGTAGGVGAGATGGIVGGLGAIGGVVGGGAVVGGGIVAALTAAVYGGLILASPEFAEAHAKQPWIQKMIDKIPNDWLPTRGKIGEAADFSETQKRFDEMKGSGEVYNVDTKDMSREERIKSYDEFKKNRAKIRSAPDYKSNKQVKLEYEATKKIAEERAKQIKIDKRILDELASITDVYEAHSQLLGEITEASARSGLAKDREAFNKTLDDNLALLSKQEVYLKQIQSEEERGLETGIQELLNSKILNREEREILIAKKEQGGETIILGRELKLQTSITQQLAGLEKERADTIVDSIHNERAQSLKLSQQEATYASQMVELYDNFAIGVGASVAMRMKAFQAEGQNIKILQEERQMIIDKINEENLSLAENKKLQSDIQEIDNQILSSEQKRAQQTRSVKDGWISAISAMNTGAGVFSEIIMTGQQNVAQVSRLPGSIRSSMSGAYAGRGRGGRVTENIGFRGGEQFNQQGQISRRGGGVGDLSYLTFMDEQMGFTRRGGGISGAMWNEREMIEKMGKGANYTAGGGFEALSVGSNEMRKSYSANGGGMNVLSDRDIAAIREIASRASKQTAEIFADEQVKVIQSYR